MLGRRDYTAAELRRKLTDRDHAPEDIDAALKDLISRRFVDDRRVAAAHVRSASGLKSRGRHRIRQELEARGVDRALVRELLSELPVEDEAAAIARVLARKRLPPRLDAATHRRVFQQLLRRGFPADAIAKALRTRSDDE